MLFVWSSVDCWIASRLFNITIGNNINFRIFLMSFPI